MTKLQNLMFSYLSIICS